MIDGATLDEEKVTPVYKLEEICELLRSSHSSIVKELSDFILKRLQHKSPIVKQKVRFLLCFDGHFFATISPISLLFQSYILESPFPFF